MSARKKIAAVLSPAPPAPYRKATADGVLAGLRAFYADTGTAPISFIRYETASKDLRKADPSLTYPTAYAIQRFHATMPDAWRAAGVEPEPGEAPRRSSVVAPMAKGSLAARLERLSADALALKAEVEQLEARAAAAESSLAKVRAATRALASLEL